MATYDATITRLAARAGRAETEVDALREEVELLRATLDLAERRFTERLDAAAHRTAFAREQLAVSRALGEQRLADERAARIRAEVTLEISRQIRREQAEAEAEEDER